MDQSEIDRIAAWGRGVANRASKSTREQWLDYGRALLYGKKITAGEPNKYKEWIKTNGLTVVQGTDRSNATRLVKLWPKIEPYTRRGQPLEELQHPYKLLQGYKNLGNSIAVDDTEIVYVSGADISDIQSAIDSIVCGLSVMDRDKNEARNIFIFAIEKLSDSVIKAAR
jgi:hypothetical protein